MKKTIVFISLFLLLASFGSAASVSRNMPRRIDPGKTLKVEFNLGNMEVGKTFTLQDKIPTEFEVKDWEVEGSQQTKENIDYRAERNGWSFTANPDKGNIVYYIDIPPTASGKYEFVALWFSPSGMNRDKSILIVGEKTCGDNYCEGDETPENCPDDCKKIERQKPAITEAGEYKIKEEQGGFYLVTGGVVGTAFKKSPIFMTAVIIFIIELIIASIYLHLKQGKATKAKKKKHRNFKYAAVAILAILVVLTVVKLPKKEVSSFAQCLNESKAIFFTTKDCVPCKEQEKMFGDSIESIIKIECDKELDKCKEIGVEGLPSWSINEKLVKGKKSFEELAELSGCRVK